MVDGTARSKFHISQSEKACTVAQLVLTLPHSNAGRCQSAQLLQEL